MLGISERQAEALRAGSDRSYDDALVGYFSCEHPSRTAELGAATVKAVVKRVVFEARHLGMEDGRAIARLATVALLVDTEIFEREEVKALFAFSGISADLKADLLCEHLADQLRAVGVQPPR